MVESTGINFFYLFIQVVVLGIACLMPLLLMWLAFRFVNQRQGKMRGELVARRPLTAEGVMVEAVWLGENEGYTAVEIYRRADGLFVRPVKQTE